MAASEADLSGLIESMCIFLMKIPRAKKAHPKQRESTNNTKQNDHSS
ncbi:hypothetical protein VH1709_contig00017-0001 [Vibrio harveyi]|nr:hypothetical protein VH1709_contig00017-0001 [Vibrio harveyi]